MGRRTISKRQLDKGIQEHKDEIVEFTLISDDVGVIDLKTTAGELFENMQLVFIDPALRDLMTTGKIYGYAQSNFKGACKPEPCYMFKAGVDPEKPDLFQLDSTKKYDHYQVYAFPMDVITKWVQAKKKTAVHTGCLSWDVPEGFDVEALTDFIETIPSPEELDEYLIANGATPHKAED